MDDAAKQKEVDHVLGLRNKALVIHELDTIFGVGNPFTAQFKITGQIPISKLSRAGIRQQYHNVKRLEAIEEKIGIKWDPLSLDNRGK